MPNADRCFRLFRHFRSGSPGSRYIRFHVPAAAFINVSLKCVFIGWIRIQMCSSNTRAHRSLTVLRSGRMRAFDAIASEWENVYPIYCACYVRRSLLTRSFFFFLFSSNWDNWNGDGWNVLSGCSSISQLNRLEPASNEDQTILKFNSNIKWNWIEYTHSIWTW